MCKSFLLISGIVFFFNLSISFATPHQIILIRHADKITQADPGDTISAKGEGRAINFAFYFINKFNHVDYIFASDPKASKSLRQVQTVAPLANLLTEKNQQAFPVLHPYESSEYEKLAQDILKDDKYNNKIILICWDQEHLPDFANKLGVKVNIPDWPAEDFDSVYILDYSGSKLVYFTILHQQYPVTTALTWDALYKKINS